MKVIDVSHWQGNIDFAKVKAEGIEGVIIKAGGSDAGFYEDSCFQRYYADAKAQGLHIGTYYFVGKGCISAEDGKVDAIRFENIIAGKQFDLPVYMDVEAPDAKYKSGITDSVVAFCDYLEKRGYYVGVYGSDLSGFRDRMELSRVKSFTLWVARYGSKPTNATEWGIWQYSESGRVNGINDNSVDMNECIVDFPSIIKNGGFNGYGKGTVSEPIKTETTTQVTSQPQVSVNTYRVKAGDTLSGIASKFGTTYQNLASINDIADPNKIYVGQVLKVTGSASTSSAEYYTVKAGDTLSGIASKYGTTYQAIAKLNGIADPNKIYVNQKLRVK